MIVSVPLTARAIDARRSVLAEERVLDLRRIRDTSDDDPARVTDPGRVAPVARAERPQPSYWSAVAMRAHRNFEPGAQQ
jgi:hypothetical protein